MSTRRFQRSWPRFRFFSFSPRKREPDQITAPLNSPDAKWGYQESFWADNAKRFDSLSFWPRVPMILLTVVLGFLVFRFARELFGPRAAVLAVALFSLEPTVLAHGRVVQTDIPAAFGYLLLFMALSRYARERTWRRAAWLGAAAAIAILAKFSMLLAGPVLAVFFLGLWWRAATFRSTSARPLSRRACIMSWPYRAGHQCCILLSTPAVCRR